MNKSKVFYQDIPRHCQEKWERFCHQFPSSGSLSFETGAYLAENESDIVGKWEPGTGIDAYMPIVRKIQNGGKGRPAWALLICPKEHWPEFKADRMGYMPVWGYPVGTMPLDEILAEVENGLKGGGA